MMLPSFLPLFDGQLSTAAFRVPRLTARRIHAPVLLRSVSGVTVPLDGRDSIDYHQDSVTIGVSARRPSRIPYAMNIID